MSNTFAKASDRHDYSIIRFYRNSRIKQRVMQKGLTLAEAQAHCNDPKTRGANWFDGYTNK